MTTYRSLFFALLLVGSAGALWAQPAFIDTIDFEDLPGAGTIVDPLRYQSQGIVLGCNPGHDLYAVERDGPDGPYGLSIAVSAGGSDPLYITVEIFEPYTPYESTVQRMNVDVLDAANTLYEWAYTDLFGNPLVSGSNIGDASIGEGFWYSDGPIAHMFTVWVTPTIYIDNISFSEISEPLGNRDLSWGQIKSLF